MPWLRDKLGRSSSEYEQIMEVNTLVLLMPIVERKVFDTERLLKDTTTEWFGRKDEKDIG